MNKNTQALNEALVFALEKVGRKNIKLKEQQYDAISKIVVDKQDTVCVLPTGYGKSLIYQLLPDVFDYYLFKTTHARQTKRHSTVIVISPLNALMLDQVNKLQKCMKVCILKDCSEEMAPGSNEHASTPANMVEKIEQYSQIIFAHPEALMENKRVFHKLSSTSFQNRIKAIVIDEAHLVKEW
jgi:superfamily II DNA helicase RecQ